MRKKSNKIRNIFLTRENDKFVWFSYENKKLFCIYDGGFCRIKNYFVKAYFS